MVRVSVIIPAFHEESAIVRAIESAQASGADEVIVVDGGSHDATREVSRAANATVLQCEPGRAIQQNRGAAEATGDILVFLHADSWLDERAIAQVRELSNVGPIVFGGFRQRIDATGFGYRLLESGNAARIRWTGLVYGDQGLFVGRTVFEQVGGFETVPIMEDVRLSRRLTRVSRPKLLAGPIHTSARRWQRNGIVRQTLRNWTMLTAHSIGVSPERLKRFYPNHG